MIIIRLAQQSDILTILEIRKVTFSHFAPSSYTPQEVATLLEDIRPTEFEEMINNQSLFVAERREPRCRLWGMVWRLGETHVCLTRYDEKRHRQHSFEYSRRRLQKKNQ
jgi:hypothetical protein